MSATNPPRAASLAGEQGSSINQISRRRLQSLARPQADLLLARKAASKQASKPESRASEINKLCLLFNEMRWVDGMRVKLSPTIGHCVCAHLLCIELTWPAAPCKRRSDAGGHASGLLLKICPF